MVRELGGVRALVLEATIASEADVSDLVGAAYSEGAEVIVLATEQLDEAFFRLETGLAGAVLQKLANYRFRVAVVGDLTAEIARSAALAAFVRESNRGRDVAFVADLEAVADWLAR
jgi:hypothetical protein